MKLRLLTATAIAITFIYGCSASTSNERSDNESEVNATGKPGDESEGLPGYLVDPQSLSSENEQGTPDVYTLSGPAGSVSVDDQNFENMYISAWAYDGSNKPTILLAAVIVSSDGSFQISVDVENTDLIVLQTSNGSPGTFRVRTSDSGESNSVLMRPQDSDYVSSYFTNLEFNDIDENSESESSSLAIVYLNKETQTLTDTVEAQIEIHNSAFEPSPVTDHTVRYYFTADGLTPEIELTSATNIPSENLSITYDSSGAFISFELVGDITISANDNLKIRFIVTSTEGSDYDQSNDPSFDSSYTSKGLSRDIHIFKDDAKIWGD